MRGSWILPGPRPGATLGVEMPLMVGGWLGGGRYSGGMRIVVEGATFDVRDEERDLVVSTGVMADWEVLGLEKMEWVVARLSGSPLGEISNSGKVMKKRQPKVVPKKAPSTDWKRLLGGV